MSRDDLSTRKGGTGGTIETPAAQMPGAWTFDYSVIPHSSGWQSASKQAYAFEALLRAVSVSPHAGSLPGRGSYVAAEPPEFVISSVKEAESGHGWLVCGYNLAATDLRASLKPWQTFKHVDRVNLAEEKLETLQAGPQGVSLAVRGHEIVTLLFSD